MWFTFWAGNFCPLYWCHSLFCHLVHLCWLQPCSCLLYVEEKFQNSQTSG
jgi:hypothetical protein